MLEEQHTRQNTREWTRDREIERKVGRLQAYLVNCTLVKWSLFVCMRMCYLKRNQDKMTDEKEGRSDRRSGKKKSEWFARRRAMWVAMKRHTKRERAEEGEREREWRTRDTTIAEAKVMIHNSLDDWKLQSDSDGECLWQKSPFNTQQLKSLLHHFKHRKYLVMFPIIFSGRRFISFVQFRCTWQSDLQ